MRNIVLIGMSGAGKTSIGKELAKDLSFSFIDTDDLIESNYGEISKIFREYGEKGFRDLEIKTISSLAFNRTVIATGGGSVLNSSNVKKMKELGIVIYLEPSQDKIIRNIRSDKLNKRPLLQDNIEDRLLYLSRDRKPLYKLASDCTIKISDKDSIKDVVENIKEFLKNLL